MRAPTGADVKRRIVLAWSYERRSFVAPFEALRDRFDFVFMSQLRPGVGAEPTTDMPRVYWEDFRDPDELIAALRPDLIVFMGIFSGREICLNAVARARGIETIVLQHGIAFNVRASVSKPSRPTAQGLKKSAETAIRASRYVGSSLGRLGLVPTLRFVSSFLSYQFTGYSRLTRRLRREGGRPSRYVCWDPTGAEYYQFQDGIDPATVTLIGNPEFDAILAPPHEVQVPPTPYYLLLDSAIADNPWNDTLVTRATMLRVYDRLATFAASEGARLRVKLHPYCYGATWLPRDPRIDWLRDADLGVELRGARGCFALPTTLIVVAVLLADTCILSPHPDPLVDDLVKRGATNVVDLATFEPTRALLRPALRHGPTYDAFVARYLYAADGRAVERLAEVLQGASPDSPARTKAAAMARSSGESMSSALNQDIGS